MQSGSNTLCERCQQIDFVKGFKHPKPQGYTMGLVKQILDEHQCPLCRTIVTELLKRKEYSDHTDIAVAGLYYNITFTLRGRAKQNNLKQVRGYNSMIVSLGTTLEHRPLSDKRLKSYYFAYVGIFDDDTKLINPWSYYIRRPLSTSTNTGNIRDWLATCDENHTHQALTENVQKMIRTPLEGLKSKGLFRMIDVETKAVVEIKDSPRYLALSYCWGKAMGVWMEKAEKRVKANGAKSDLNLTSSLIPDLPQTITDAMSVTKQLGLRYLWVDAVCIDQWDIASKLEVINHMQEIYRGAYATIIAAAGADAGAGICTLDANFRRADIPTTFLFDSATISILPSVHGLATILSQSTWDSRAWTQQEYLLSTRSILFTSDEVFFSCPKGIHREAYSYQHVGQFRRRSESPDRQTRFSRLTGLEQLTWIDYCRIVANYSKRSLTVTGDRLDAFSGTFSSFCAGHELSAQSGGIAAFCRLPPAWFGTALLWGTSRDWPFPTRVETDAAATRQIPSWCWAGWTGSVTYNPVNEDAHGKEVDMSLWHLELLDAHNVMFWLREDASDGHQWPARRPMAVPKATIPSVVLHLWVPVIQCYFAPYSSPAPPPGAGKKDKKAPSETRHTDVYIERTKIGTAFVDPAWLKQQSAKEPRHLALFPGSEQILRTNTISIAMLFRRTEGFTERVPISIRLGLPLAKLIKYAEYENIRMR